MKDHNAEGIKKREGSRLIRLQTYPSMQSLPCNDWIGVYFDKPVVIYYRNNLKILDKSIKVCGFEPVE